MPKKNTRKQPDPDWELVARDYVNGVMTLKEICDKYTDKRKKTTLNISRLHYQMKKRGYHQKRLEVSARLKKKPIPDSESTDIVVQEAANALQEVTRRHVEGLGRTQRIVDVMLTNLEECIESALTCKDQEKIKRPLFLGGRETVADYVRKLGEVQTKAITQERKCLGLDKEIDDDTIKPYEERLKELHDLSPGLPEPDDAIEGEFTEVH